MVTKFLKATQRYYAPLTQKERRRKLRRITGIMSLELGCPRSPHHIEDKHVIMFLDWMDEKDLNHETQRRYLRYLKDYLAYYDNIIVSQMLIKKQIRAPSGAPPEIRALTKENVDFLHQMTLTMDGWHGVVARFITMAYPYTGLRPSELRTMKYTDVDKEDGNLTVTHPKGEGRYGKHRCIGILPQLRPAFQEFLEERKLFLEELGATEDFEAFIPYKGRWGLDYWGSSQLNALKMKIEARAGLKFKLKDYRATFCQLAIDLGADLQAVSKIMGHKSSVTTETYYGRIRDDAAIREIERAFSEPMSVLQFSREQKKGQ